MRERERERILGAVSAGADLIGNIDTTAFGEAKSITGVDTTNLASSRLQAIAGSLAVRGGLSSAVEGLNTVAAGHRNRTTAPQVAEAGLEVG